MTSLSELLRSAREAHGLSYDEVARATRIRAKYVEALEEGRFAELPGEVYTRGFLRNYALYLGLSYADVLAAYEAAVNGGRNRPSRPVPVPLAAAAVAAPARPRGRLDASSEHPVSPTPVDTRLRYPPSWNVVSVLVIVILIASYLIYSTYTGSQRERPTPTPLPATPTDIVALLPTTLVSQTPVHSLLPTPGPPGVTPPTPAVVVTGTLVPGASPGRTTGATPPAALPSATAVAQSGGATATAPLDLPTVILTPGSTLPPAPGGYPTVAIPISGTVTVQVSNASAPVWYRVDVDGSLAFQGTLPAGSVRSWTGSRTVRVRSGRGDIVHVTVNGADRGLLGSPQQTIVTKEWDTLGNETIVQ